MEQSGVVSESEWVKTISSASFSSSPLTKKKKRKRKPFSPGKAGFPQVQFGVLMPLAARARNSNNHHPTHPPNEPPTFNLLIQGLGQAQNQHTG